MNDNEEDPTLNDMLLFLQQMQAAHVNAAMILGSKIEEYTKLTNNDDLPLFDQEDDDDYGDSNG